MLKIFLTLWIVSTGTMLSVLGPGWNINIYMVWATVLAMFCGLGAVAIDRSGIIDDVKRKLFDEIDRQNNLK